MGVSYSAPQTTLPQRDAEFDALTPQEKEIVYRDLYGSSNNYLIDEDDDEVVENGLTMFEKHLSELSDDDKECYLRALERSPDYVQDKNFRLQFLRCELFDPKLAAIRFARYWKEKVEVWGEEKAFHKIKLDDFDEIDLLVLRNRVYQGLKMQDKFNRSILILHNGRLDQSNRNSMIRVMWYTYECLLENVNAQRNGFVILSGLLQDALQYTDRKFTSVCARVSRYALPIRIVAIHFVVTSSLMQFIIPYGLYLIGSEWRHRFKIHSNRNLLFSKLEKFGISKTIIPKELGGTCTFSFKDWLEEQK